MMLYAVIRRGVALLLLVTLWLGQPGSVCAIHCLFPRHGARGADDVVLIHADAGPSSETTPGVPASSPAACHGDQSQLSQPLVQVAAIGPMAASASITSAAAPAALNDAVRAGVPAPEDILPTNDHPPPRA